VTPGPERVVELDITSPGNERVKRLRRLRNRRSRDAEGLFVVEEERIISRAIRAGRQPVEVYWCPELCDRPTGIDAPVVTMSEEAADRASYRTSSSGLIALFPYFSFSPHDLELPASPLLLVAESIEKPGNLGALLRIADGAGADGLVVVGADVDLFNPNAVRSSTGALFTVQIAVFSDPANVVDWLEHRGVESLAAVPGGTTTLWDADLTGPRALWVGSEAFGLSAGALERLPHTVSIPMAGASDSLNTSVAAALLVYEAIRQRTTQAGGPANLS